MVVIDKNGTIYDIPAKELESCAIQSWITKKDEINELTNNLMPVFGKLEEFQRKAIKDGHKLKEIQWCNLYPKFHNVK